MLGIFLIMASDAERPTLIVGDIILGPGIPDFIDGERELRTCPSSLVACQSSREINSDMPYQTRGMGEMLSPEAS